MTTQTAAPDVPSPAETMLRLSCSPILSRALVVAAKLGVADLVHNQPQTADQLAAATGTHAPSLYRVLRALASIGIFSKDEAQCFGPTPLAECLRTDVPGSLRDWVVYFFGAEFHWNAWGDLLHSVQTGEPAFDHARGMNAFEYFERSPEDGALFNRAMTTISQSVSGAVVNAYDFSPFDTLVDVGGGHGSLLAAILQANPPLRGVLADLPSVVEGARQPLEAAGLAHRCRLDAGDFFESVPRGDAYILKSVLHDWDDARARTILQNIRRAIMPRGKLLLVELVVPPGNEASMATLIDLEMLVMTPGGRERTDPEFRALFESAGFALTRIVPTQSPMCIIEGTPIS